jgi:hypothetical protein
MKSYYRIAIQTIEYHISSIKCEPADGWCNKPYNRRGILPRRKELMWSWKSSFVETSADNNPLKPWRKWAPPIKEASAILCETEIASHKLSKP